jgi:hypothetical protein
LEQSLSAEEITNQLLAEYDIDAVACRNEVDTFIEDMLDKKLITIENS